MEQGENKKVNHLEIMKLLPWYVNRTLGKAENHKIEQHLEHCGSCVWEVEELRLIKASVVDLDNKLPRPTRDPLQLALAHIQREGGEASELPGITDRSDNERGLDERGRHRRSPWSRLWRKLGVLSGDLKPAGSGGRLSWAFAPALALLLVVGFQNLVSIPRLRTELNTLSSPNAVNYHVLPPQARSESIKIIEMKAGRPFLFFEIDINPPEDTPLPQRFLIQVSSPEAGKSPLQFAVPGDSHLVLRLLAEDLDPGSHEILVMDARNPIDANPLGRYPFQLRLKGGDQ